MIVSARIGAALGYGLCVLLVAAAEEEAAEDGSEDPEVGDGRHARGAAAALADGWRAPLARPVPLEPTALVILMPRSHPQAAGRQSGEPRDIATFCCGNVIVAQAIGKRNLELQ